MRVLPGHITEAAFLEQTIDLLHQYRWRVIHVHHAQVREGKWITPGMGDIAGWPDLFAVRGHRALASELKRTRRDKPSQGQLDWLAALSHVSGIECHVWRPEDWDQIVETVK